jgi:hypothetical protein
MFIFFIRLKYLREDEKRNRVMNLNGWIDKGELDTPLYSKNPFSQTTQEQF